MKKVPSLLLVFTVFISLIFGFSLTAQASGIEKAISGTVTKITYNQTGSSEEIKIYSTKTKILRQFILPPGSDCKNYRLGIEIADAGITKNGSFDVNQGSVVQIRYAGKSDPQAASIVVESKIKPQYTLVASSDGKSLVLSLSGGITNNAPATPSATPKPSNTPTPNQTPAATPAPSATPVPAGNTTGQSGATAKSGPLSMSIQGNACILRFEGINLTSAYGNTGRVPEIEYRSTEKILQITLPGKDTRYNKILAGNSIVHGILANYNDKLDSTLIRIAFNDQVSYTKDFTSGSTLITIKTSNSTGSGTIGSNTNPTQTPAPTPTPTPKPSPSPTPAPTPTPKPTTEPSRGDNTDRSASVGVAFSPDSITLSTPNANTYKVYRLGNPSRIVIEVPGTIQADQKTMPSGYLYQKATVAQTSGTTAQITIDTADLPDWSTTAAGDKLTVKLAISGTINIQGGDSNTEVALRITGNNIVNRFHQYSGNIYAEDDPKSNTFAFLLPSGIVSLGQGSAKINNSMVNSINTLTTEDSSFLQLIKNDATKQFKIIEGTTSNELLVVAGSTGSSGNTAGASAGAKGKLVVLDPGHGGSDPGADVGGYYEKDFDLDISLRAEAILKQKGINVQLTRRTDTFVDLDQRCEIANSLKANLFVCIHNNAMPSPSYKGSMAFYYPTSYKGKAYARIFLDNLVKGLNLGGMGTEGLKSAEYVVLKKTLMPAALVEVACMTNSGDLSMLATENFRQQAAENIANSIVQILNSMN